jgi:anti-sigma factor ChrR (cupin superfamily)
MILERFMPSCREVADKLAEGELENLPWHTRLLLRWHLSMCEHCRRFAAQIELIGKALREHWSHQPPLDRLEAIKRRVMARLK